MRRFSITLLALGAFLSAGMAIAAQDQQMSGKQAVSADQFVQYMDKDSDGRLSDSEIKDFSDALRDADKDDNGYVSSSEARQALSSWDTKTAGIQGSGRMQSGQTGMGGQTQGKQTSASDWIAKHDKNKDGYVSKDEFPGADSVFSQCDTDSDSRLSSSEVGTAMQRGPQGYSSGQAGRMSSGGQSFAQFDADSSGSISKSEWKGSDDVFTRHDADRDGRLSRSEFQSIPQSQTATGAASSRGETYGYADESMSRSGQSGQQWIRTHDKNQDGRVAKNEFTGSDAAFNRIDSNRDGMITESEAQRYSRNAQGGAMSGTERSGEYYEEREQSDYDRQMQQDRMRQQSQSRQQGGMRQQTQAQQRQRVNLQQWDANSDGYVSRSEWRGLDSEFRRLDRNSDEFVSQSEIRAARGTGETYEGGAAMTGRARPSISRYDRNNDGRVSRGEWTGSEDEFARMDANSDGWLSSSELQRPAGERMTAQPSEQQRIRSTDVQWFIERYDDDQDGRVSSKELDGVKRDFDEVARNDEQEYLTQRDLARTYGRDVANLWLALYDANRDGSISEKEYDTDIEDIGTRDEYITASDFRATGQPMRGETYGERESREETYGAGDWPKYEEGADISREGRQEGAYRRDAGDREMSGDDYYGYYERDTDTDTDTYDYQDEDDDWWPFW
jgi:Ca2+-binding EF-hand superfamily protein